MPVPTYASTVCRRWIGVLFKVVTHFCPTHDLLIASPTPYRYATWQSVFNLTVKWCVDCWTMKARSHSYRKLNDFANSTRLTTQSTSTNRDAASPSRGPGLAEAVVASWPGHRGHGRRETWSALTEQVSVNDRTRAAEIEPDESFLPTLPRTTSQCKTEIDIFIYIFIQQIMVACKRKKLN